MAKQKIRMRTCKNEAVCELCTNNTNNSLEMFDLQIGATIHTLCDQCIDQLFNKCLSGVCYVNNKVKSPHDMAIIRKRNVVKRENTNTITINEALEGVNVDEDNGDD